MPDISCKHALLSQATHRALKTACRARSAIGFDELLEQAIVAERPASPAAAGRRIKPSLADESPALRGRVHAVVRRAINVNRSS